MNKRWLSAWSLSVMLLLVSHASAQHVTLIGIYGVSAGGTGASTFTTNGVLYGNGTSAVQVTAQGAANTILTANAGAPSFSTTPTISQITFGPAASTGTVAADLTYTGAAHTALTASTERFDTNWNSARTVQWATGALTTQRFHVWQAPTVGFVAASTVTTVATTAITGPPVQGTNATLTNTYGLLIQAGAVSTATNAFGLSVSAPTGATNNYAAVFPSGNVGIGRTNPQNLLHVDGAGIANQTNILWLGTNSASQGNLRMGISTADGTGSAELQGYTSNTTSTLLLNRAGGNIGIGTASPTNILSVTGQAAQTWWLERNTTTNTAGNNLTIRSGGATSMATDKNAGDLILGPGTATGTGKAKTQLQSAIAGATGTADRTAATHIQVSQGHLVSLGTAPAVSACGTGATIVGNDIAGKVTIGTGTITSCTVTFATAYDTNAPACLTEDTSAVLATSSSTTTTVLTIASSTSMASAVVSYICLGME